MAESLFKGHPVVTTLNYGLSDIDGEMMLHCRSGCSSLASFRNEGRMGMSAIQVPVYRGDTVVDRFEVPPPDIIKIDVEGFEGEVIRGMERIMRTKRPVIVFEHLFLSDEAVAALDGNDYTVRTILRGGTLHGSGFARGAGKDSALMPREKLGEVRPSSCETQEGGRLSTHNMSLPQSRK
jgi:FkbM family methyltransferase